VARQAAQRGETAIGYRLRGYGVNVNPKKSDMHTFTERDQIVVLAEN
jgi:hypothetical protein